MSDSLMAKNWFTGVTAAAALLTLICLSPFAIPLNAMAELIPRRKL